MHTLTTILTPGRTLCRAPGVSKKRLFETLARLISDDQPALSYSEVFTQLIGREKLGSTGLGKGIAIPHCRVSSCDRPVGSLLTLEDPIDFDAPDGLPVDILFVLLVPEGAQQQHLDILADLASRFSEQAFCDALRRADDAAALYATATRWAAAS